MAKTITKITAATLKSRLKKYQKLVDGNAPKKKIEAFKAEQAALMQAYVNKELGASKTPKAVEALEAYLDKFRQEKVVSTALADKVSERFDAELTDQKSEKTRYMYEGVGRGGSYTIKLPGENENDDDQSKEDRSPAQQVYADHNHYVMDAASVKVYNDMGEDLVDPEQIGELNQLREENDLAGHQELLFNIVDGVKNLEGKDADEFSSMFIDYILDPNNQDLSDILPQEAVDRISKTRGNDREGLFELVPPAALARAYNVTKKRLANEKDDNEKNALQYRLNRLGARMDELSAQFDINAAYYFGNPNRIADVYHGYMEMFAAREVDLKDDAQKKAQIKSNKEKLEEYMADYDERYNLTDLTPKDAKKLDKRHNEITKKLNKAKIRPETLARVSKYTFYDESDKKIPQFIDEEGGASLEYKPGYKVIPGSETDRLIGLAKNQVAMENIGKLDEKIDQGELEDALNEAVLFQLFQIDNVGRTVRGALDDPKNFADKNHYEKFLNTLDANGGEISTVEFDAAMDAAVNETGGYVNRMTDKIGPNQPVLFKVLDNVDNLGIDKRGGMRAETDVGATQGATRKKLWWRSIKGFGNALLTSAAITTVAAGSEMIFGMPRTVAALAMGVALGLGFTGMSIWKWNKDQTAKGEPHGWDRVKSFFSDKRNIATIATTALAATALTTAAVGAPATFTYLAGASALALGMGTNAVNTYNEASAGNLGNGEKVLLTAVNAIAPFIGGLLGRFGAMHAINSYNASHPTNTNFSHGVPGEKEVQTTKMVNHPQEAYQPGVNEHAHEILNHWYHDKPEVLQQRLDMAQTYINDHHLNISPERLLLMHANNGGQTFGHAPYHVDGGGVTHYDHNHNTMNTPQWRADHPGFTGDDSNAVKHLFDGGKMNPKGVEAAMRMDRVVSGNNEVGSVSAGDTPHYDGVLPRNTVDAHGHPVYNTYADGNSPFHKVDHWVSEPDVIKVPVTNFVPNVVIGQLGMVGEVNNRPNMVQKIKGRIGTLMDKVWKRESDAISDDNVVQSEGTPENKKGSGNLFDKAKHLLTFKKHKDNVQNLKDQAAEDYNSLAA
ncbi:MAG: hypothetical protein FWC51_04735 [Proteobacteria bacterium]|nr:hypothetical protein [Pseudomonadota bacterium]